MNDWGGVWIKTPLRRTLMDLVIWYLCRNDLWKGYLQHNHIYVSIVSHIHTPYPYPEQFEAYPQHEPIGECHVPQWLPALTAGCTHMITQCLQQPDPSCNCHTLDPEWHWEQLSPACRWRSLGRLAMTDRQLTNRHMTTIHLCHNSWHQIEWPIMWWVRWPVTNLFYVCLCLFTYVWSHVLFWKLYIVPMLRELTSLSLNINNDTLVLVSLSEADPVTEGPAYMLSPSLPLGSHVQTMGEPVVTTHTPVPYHVSCCSCI